MTSTTDVKDTIEEKMEEFKSVIKRADDKREEVQETIVDPLKKDYEEASSKVRDRLREIEKDLQEEFQINQKYDTYKDSENIFDNSDEAKKLQLAEEEFKNLQEELLKDIELPKKGDIIISHKNSEKTIPFLVNHIKLSLNILINRNKEPFVLRFSCEGQKVTKKGTIDKRSSDYPEYASWYVDLKSGSMYRQYFNEKQPLRFMTLEEFKKNGM